MLGGDKVVVQAVSLLCASRKNAIGTKSYVARRATCGVREGWDVIESLFKLSLHVLDITTKGRDDLRRQAVSLLQKRQKDMLNVKLRLPLGEHDLLRSLQHFLRLFCKSAHHSPGISRQP